jgi:hypothetical protein
MCPLCRVIHAWWPDFAPPYNFQQVTSYYYKLYILRLLKSYYYKLYIRMPTLPTKRNKYRKSRWRNGLELCLLWPWPDSTRFKVLANEFESSLAETGFYAKWMSRNGTIIFIFPIVLNDGYLRQRQRRLMHSDLFRPFSTTKLRIASLLDSMSLFMSPEPFWLFSTGPHGRQCYCQHLHEMLSPRK